ncbi:MAG: alcohol dehydrogenase catalytic domain-containing protein [Ignavibacteria bacterium]|nr:alcohol dehydrogenase catalytic domain-containing protein [Ignavibacteria bacterium]MBI3766406.1 alcohol dehydrogenase catalytic domain-containing protein [Ignavibacteriales bacterium]
MKAVVKPKPELYTVWPKGLSLVEKEIPVVEHANDVRLKVVAGGICGTDVGIYNSKDSLKNIMSSLKTHDVTIGHEFCGRITDAGPKAKVRLAQLVIQRSKDYADVKRYVKNRSALQLSKDKTFIEFVNNNFISTAEMHITCGICAQCKLGEYHVCANTVICGLHADGAFAEYVVLPVSNVLIFKNGEIPEEIVAFMDAIGNATHTVQALTDIRGKSVAVLGVGVIGLMSVAIAKAAGAKTIFVTDASHGENTHEKLEGRRFTIARLLGADECFDVSIPKDKERFYKSAKRQNHGAGVDAVLEMSGSYHAYEDAFRILRMGGEIALLGLTNGTMPIDFAKNIIFPGVTVHGVIGRRVWSTWDMMIRILRGGLAKRFLKSGFITHQFPLKDFEKGFDAIASGDALKVLLRP